MESVLDVSRNLPLKFIKIRSVTNEILLTLNFCGGMVCNIIFRSSTTKDVEVELSCGSAGVLTKMLVHKN